LQVFFNKNLFFFVGFPFLRANSFILKLLSNFISKNKMITIKKITATKALPIRHQILRKGEPIEKCMYPGDDFESTLHFGLFENEILSGIISVFETKNKVFNDEKQFQIRGMAVLENKRKKGFGAALVHHVEVYLKKEKQYAIWFNARIVAIGFYEKLGYVKIGAPFEIDTIGIHYIMHKKQ
jgi:GNAT superfamily N-acetyltransferase